MLEIKVTVELPGIPEALNNLADAIRGNGKPAASRKGKNTETAEKPAVKQESAAPAIAPVEQPEQAPPLAEVPKAEPEPSFIGSVPPDEEPVPAIPSAPVPAPIPAPVPVAAPEPAPVKKYTFRQISKAGAALCTNPEKMAALVKLLNEKYGVQAITMIGEEKYPELAADIIAMGATIEEEA